MKKNFSYGNGFVYYQQKDGKEGHLYVEDSWNEDENISIEKIEKDFDEMIFQCGENFDAENRKDLFIFCYAVAKGWIK